MGQTIAEKILEAHRIGGDQHVEPGSVVRAKVDFVLLNDANGPVAFRHFANMGGGKVAVPEKIGLVCDHFAPAPSAAGARMLGDMRRFARDKGIELFFDVGKGASSTRSFPSRDTSDPATWWRVAIPIPARPARSMPSGPA